MSKKRKRVHFLFVFLILIFHSPPSSAVDLLFNGFRTSDLDLFADATLEPFPITSSSDASRRRFLSLTANSNFSLGRALYPSPIPTKASNHVLPFSASFIFSIATVPRSLPGHGIAFLFAPASGTLAASSAQHLGLFNLSSDGDPGARVFAVEFDLFQNQEFLDINANHVGVDRNSLTSVASKAAGYWPDDEGGFVGLILNDGSNYQVWVDYIGGRLNVTMAPAAHGRKPRRPLISTEIDLSDLFLDEMHIGFCGATGQLVERHRVLAWSFSNSNFSASDGLITSGLPNFIPPASQSGAISRRRLVTGLSVTAAVLVISAAMAAHWIRILRSTKRRKRGVESEEVLEEWESEYWPHRIGYQEILVATEAFSDSNLIGRGGNGRVYKGDLGGAQVAVKLFYQTNEEEAKQFAAEVSTLGRLKHRNLVSFRGWCRARRATAAGGEVMILVYDYMENGSLEQWIFGTGMSLNWKSRARILRDVAAAALYLHEGWGEAVVLHRDIKASNVMLDGEMAGRLGDFGLARAHDRGLALGTTRVVGSAGYLAPEVVRTGRATSATDVYAFGVLALEVASGRRAAAEGQSPLVAWAREAAAVGGEAAVVDARARASEGYDDWEAARVVAMGLACTLFDAAARPSMRQVVRLLDGREDDAADGREDPTSWLLDARLRILMEPDNKCSFEGRLRQKQQHHLTFEELRQSLSCSTPHSGSDVTLEAR